MAVAAEVVAAVVRMAHRSIRCFVGNLDRDVREDDFTELFPPARNRVRSVD